MAVTWCSRLEGVMHFRRAAVSMTRPSIRVAKATRWSPFTVSSKSLIILGQPPKAGEPGERAFHHPAARQQHKALPCLGQLDDLQANAPPLGSSLRVAARCSPDPRRPVRPCHRSHPGRLPPVPRPARDHPSSAGVTTSARHNSPCVCDGQVQPRALLRFLCPS